jgi:hypothetical protein
MSHGRCPSEPELISFADADLPPEQLTRIEKHLELCSSCAKEVVALTELSADLASPPPAPPLDVAEHVAAVMSRLEARPRAKGLSRLATWSGGVAAAAAVALFVALRPAVPPEAELVARGGDARGSLSRDVGVQLYLQGESLEALGAGSQLPARAALTAGLRNLANERAYLLLFAVDSRQVVHWVAPAFTLEGSDPEAAPVEPAQQEQLLPSAVVFDDLALGPLRVVALISRSPLRVSQIEALPPSELTAESLMRRFPPSEIRQFLLEVRDPPRP